MKRWIWATALIVLSSLLASCGANWANIFDLN